MRARPGYTGTITRIDLSTGAVSGVPTDDYAQDFVGGHGVAAKIYWDEVSPQVGAFDPGNRLIFATGPCAGFEGVPGARWVVCGKSPANNPQFFTHSNLGGSWGAGLKAAGSDALIVQGCADKPVYILVQDGKVEIRDAAALWGKGSVEVRKILKSELGESISVVSTGLAGDNLVAPTILLADNDASGSGGLGGVMGSKRLKAIAVRGSGRVKAAQPERLQELVARVREMRRDAPTADSNDTKNTRQDSCSDCVAVCNRGLYDAEDGTAGKFMCSSASFYKDLAKKFYGKMGDVPYHATRLCDHYGLHTKAIGGMIVWLQRCHQEGLVTEKMTGLPLTKIGSLEFIQALTGNIARRQGFGDLLAGGLVPAAEKLGGRALDLLSDDTKAGESLTYAPKAFLTTGLLYAMDHRQPIQQLHEVSLTNIIWVKWAKKMPGANLSSAVFRGIARRFWGSEVAADFSTYEGKALAARMIQDREMAKESLIVCDKIFPMLYVEHSADHVGDPSMESQILSAITGRAISPDELLRAGERIFNLQRAILTREGHQGRQSDVLPEACFTVPLESERQNEDCLVPGKDGEIISRKGATFDKAKFLDMLGEYYDHRGWDRETGLQKKSQLEGLGLGDCARDLAARGLLK